MQISYPGNQVHRSVPFCFLTRSTAPTLRLRIGHARRKPVPFPPREFEFLPLQTVPAPLRDDRFSKKSADQPERQNSPQIELRIASMGIGQIVLSDQLRNQYSATPHLRPANLRPDIIPVEKSQEVSMAVAGNPGPAGTLARINRSAAEEIKTLRRNRQKASEFFVAIHACDVPFLRRHKGQGAHDQSATGNSTA